MKRHRSCSNDVTCRRDGVCIEASPAVTDQSPASGAITALVHSTTNTDDVGAISILNLVSVWKILYSMADISETVQNVFAAAANYILISNILVTR